MGSQTLMPGAILTDIKASYGATGKTRTFDPPILDNDITGERIKDFLNTLRPLQRERATLTYTFEIAATTDMAAKAKARSLVRAKNPFEPDMIEIVSTQRIYDSEKIAERNSYRVKVEVEK